MPKIPRWKSTSIISQFSFQLKTEWWSMCIIELRTCRLYAIHALTLNNQIQQGVHCLPFYYNKTSTDNMAVWVETLQPGDCDVTIPSNDVTFHLWIDDVMSDLEHDWAHAHHGVEEWDNRGHMSKWYHGWSVYMRKTPICMGVAESWGGKSSWWIECICEDIFFN